MKRAKNPWVAALLTFVVIGLGQMYNGQWGKGFGALFAGILFSLLIAAGIGAVLLPLWYIGVIIDAFVTANKLVKCPNCTKTIDREAKVCSYCSRDVVQAA